MFKIVFGESNFAQNEIVASWFETTLPTLLSNYKLEDIFNADEFGLFLSVPTKQNTSFKIRKKFR